MYVTYILFFVKTRSICNAYRLIHVVVVVVFQKRSNLASKHGTVVAAATYSGKLFHTSTAVCVNVYFLFFFFFLHMSQYSVHVCSKLDVNELLVCTIPVNIICKCLSLVVVLSYLTSIF